MKSSSLELSLELLLNFPASVSMCLICFAILVFCFFPSRCFPRSAVLSLNFVV